MRPVERRRFRYLLLVGTLLTAATVAADALNQLEFIESKLYDVRAQYCQFFFRPPDPPLHVGIDVDSLEAYGRWPWPRSRIAAAIDQLYAAGAKVVALDILFSDPDPNGTAQDEVLARSMGRGGATVTSVNLNTAPKPEARARVTGRLRALLAADLEMSADSARQALEREGVAAVGGTGDFTSEFVDERREAMFRRIVAELDAGAADPDAVRRRLLPGVNAETVADTSPLTRLFAEQYDRAERARYMHRRMRPPEPGLPAFPGANRAPPILPVARDVAGMGFTNYDPDPDGAVRALPLWLDVDGRLLPQLGLATICMAVGTRPDEVRITPGSVIVPRKAGGGGGDIVIPTHTRDFNRDKGVAHCMLVPVLGRDQWESMYDYRRHTGTAQVVSIVGALRIVSTQQRIARNQAVADQAVTDILKVTDPEAAENYAALAVAERAIADVLTVTHPEAAENYASLSAAVRPQTDMAAKALADAAEKLAEFRQIPELPAELARESARIARAADALKQFATLDRQLRDLLRQERQELADRANGRVVIIGWAADASVDFVETPVHRLCPGFFVHGAVYNAAMSGELWTVAPRWYAPAITVLLGLLTTAVVARLSPTKGSLAGLVVLAAYAAVNGVLVFDWGDTIVGTAGPVTVVAVTWAGITLTRVGIEIAERTRITRRFQSYVDPRLVAYIVEHPELKRFEGEVREMTVGFTDLAGFTSLTEQLGPRTVGLLSRYMGRMVPVIRGHRGVVHRFMGDGIMFSYGAPDPVPDHAADAVATMLAMQAALARFNDEIVAEGYPPLAMRIGVCTGQVVVGDAGADAVDYTCLGDTTNSAARLESANKAVGTRNLMDARTLELLDGRYLVRPVGRLVVPGKREGMMTFEPICPAADATDGQRRLVELTAAMVDHFQAARFEESMAAAGQVDAEFGPSKLTAVYRELCRQHLADPPANFAGTIVVREK